jgi:hypothetical protein
MGNAFIAGINLFLNPLAAEAPSLRLPAGSRFPALAPALDLIDHDASLGKNLQSKSHKITK